MNCPASPATWLMPEREAALLGGEGVGQDGGRVGLQHRPARSLQHPPADQPHRGVGADERVEGQQDRGNREHGEAAVVDPDASEHVTEPADRDDQDGLHQPVAHDHPQQVGDVARRQRVQVDAAEDRRQRDQHDGAIQGRHEHRGCGVGQRRPLVPVAASRPEYAAGDRHRLWASRCSNGAVSANRRTSSSVNPSTRARASCRLRV